MTRVSICLALLLSAVGRASPGDGKGTTDRLFDQADAVVIGEVQSGMQLGRTANFSLRVTRTIKGGDVPIGTTLNADCDLHFRGDGSLDAHFGLFFLRRTPDGRWSVLPANEGKLVFYQVYVPLPKTSGLGSTPASVRPEMGIPAIASEVAAAIEHYGNIDELGRSTHALFGISDRAVTTDIFRKLSTNRDPELKFIGLAGLIRASDDSALDELARTMVAIPGLRMRHVPLAAISWVRDDSSRTVQTLGRIASSSDAIVQRTAAESLAAIHSRESLPILGALLESPDYATREAAMEGLSQFVENLPVVTWESIPSQSWRKPKGPATYRTADTDRYSLSMRRLDPTQEAEYLRFWKLWWSRMKNQVAAKP